MFPSCEAGLLTSVPKLIGRTLHTLDSLVVLCRVLFILCLFLLSCDDLPCLVSACLLASVSVHEDVVRSFSDHRSMQVMSVDAVDA